MSGKRLAAMLAAFRYWRRSLKSKLPYVRRRQYRILQQRHDALIESLNELRPASDAAVRTVKSPGQPLTGDLCLFLTHASRPQIKAHVLAHIDSLLGAGIQVVLVVNADLPLDQVMIDPATLNKLAAAYVRENLGFDFAGWAHGLSLCGGSAQLGRLFLVNDSIVGPLDQAAFNAVIKRVRDSRSDVIGLTRNPRPVPHLQSFFLCFSGAALQSPVVVRFFDRVIALPTKDQVIDVYELRLSARLTKAGLKLEALFPPMSTDPSKSNDVFHHWQQLVEAGFPYVKTRILTDFGDDPRLRRLVPAEFYESAR